MKITSFCITLVGLMNWAHAQELSTNHESQFRVEYDQADFARRGVNPLRIEDWEDGRRTPQTEQHYEWWYFDAVLTDGTKVTAVLSDNFPVGTNNRQVQLQITTLSGHKYEFKQRFSDLGVFSKTGVDINIATNRMYGNLDVLNIKISGNNVSCDLRLERLVPSFRGGTGFSSVGDYYFGWINPIPYGRVTGTLSYDGTEKTADGAGYHDHNWGNVSPNELFDHWWWGRAQVGERTVVSAAVKVKKKWGDHTLKLLVLSTSNNTEEYRSQDLDLEIGPMMAHPDSNHVREVPSFIKLTVKSDEKKSLFLSLVNQQVLVSHDFLDDLTPFQQAVARLLGLKPWYTRFTSTPVFGNETGLGVMEYFELQ